MDKLVVSRSPEITANVMAGLARFRVPESSIPSFENFLRFLRLETGYASEHIHFMSVAERCGASTQPFTHVARVEQLDRDLQDVARDLGWPAEPGGSCERGEVCSSLLEPGGSCGRGKSCGGKWEKCNEVCRAAMETALGGASLDDFSSTAALATELYHCFEGRPRGADFDLVKAVAELYPEDVRGYEPPRRADARTC